MIRVRRADERGRTRLPWLDGRHTFSFGDFYDPQFTHFGTLRVLNDDVIAPNGGFDTHPHRDMEIVTVVLEGALRHADSMGNGSVIRPGEVQRMTAGTGVLHSEHNDSSTDPAHLLQIWVLPEAKGLTPGYEQLSIDPSRGAWTLLASRDGRLGSVTIHQQAEIHRTRLEAGDALEVAPPPGRRSWLHVATGAVTLNATELVPGDGVELDLGDSGTLRTTRAAEVLRFDVA